MTTVKLVVMINSLQWTDMMKIKIIKCTVGNSLIEAQTLSAGSVIYLNRKHTLFTFSLIIFLLQILSLLRLCATSYQH